LEERIVQQERVGAVHAGEYRRSADHRQHLARHVDDDLVGVAVGEHPGQRPASRHPVAAGVVDDDQVGPACLLALRRQPRSRPGTDDGLTPFDHRPQPRQDRGSRLCRHHTRSGCWSSSSIWCVTARTRSANASSLMCASTRSTTWWPDAMKVDSIASNRAASAAGSWNGCPGASSIDTPRSGSNTCTGPGLRFSWLAMMRPISAFSSGVVRTNVTRALWACINRPAQWGGTVSSAPKLAISTAPTDPTYGMPVRATAPRRSGPAENT